MCSLFRKTSFDVLAASLFRCLCILLFPRHNRLSCPKTTCLRCSSIGEVAGRKTLRFERIKEIKESFSLGNFHIIAKQKVLTFKPSFAILGIRSATLPCYIFCFISFKVLFAISIIGYPYLPSDMENPNSDNIDLPFTVILKSEKNFPSTSYSRQMIFSF